METATRLHLLIVEDSGDDAQLMVRTIEHGGYDVEFERVQTEAELRRALESEQWDLILCDYTLPALNAVRALELVRESGQDLPFIIVSGSIGEEMAIAALRGGAQDFMLKGNLARLVPAIRRELDEAETRRGREQAQAALRDSEARFRALVEQLPMVVYINPIEDMRRMTYISPQVEAMLGYKPQEWIRDPGLWSRLLHHEDRASVLREAERASRTGDAFDMEFRMVARDGRTVWVRDQATRVNDAGGAPSHWQGLMIDITEPKRREREWEAVARLSQALRQVQGVREILPSLLDETLSLVDSDEGSVWLQDPAGSGSYMSRQRYRGSDPLGSIPGGYDAFQSIIQGQQAMVVRELRNEPLIPAELRSRLPEGMGGAIVPLTAAGKNLGGMFINVSLPREITTDELRVLNALADLGAYAVYRAQLFEETVKHLDRLAALRSIDIAISSSFDLNMILSVVLDKITTELSVDAAAISLLKAESLSLEFAAGKGFWTPAVETALLGVAEGLPGKAIMGRSTTYIEDLNAARELIKRPFLLTDEKFVSYYGIPLVAKGKVKGVLEVFHRSRLPHDKEWLQFLEALAGQTAIAIDSSSTFQDLQRSNMELALAYDATIEGWSRALDLRDRETEGHTLRVTDMALKLGRAMGMGDEALLQLRRGGLLHDIGKMGLPDSVLLKRGRLSDDEWALMRQHPDLAHEMLAPITYLQPALDIPYCHHERWDGNGYPRGLKGEQIPLAARIFAIVDVWDALSNDRPYRPARKQEDVMRYLREESGKHFDPAVVEAFANLVAVPETS